MSDLNTSCGATLHFEVSAVAYAALERMVATGLYGNSTIEVANHLLLDRLRQEVPVTCALREHLGMSDPPPDHPAGATLYRRIPAIDGYKHVRTLTLTDGTVVYEGSMDESSWMEITREYPEERGF